MSDIRARACVHVYVQVSSCLCSFCLRTRPCSDTGTRPARPRTSRRSDTVGRSDSTLALTSKQTIFSVNKKKQTRTNTGTSRGVTSLAVGPTYVCEVGVGAGPTLKFCLLTLIQDLPQESGRICLPILGKAGV